MPVKTKIQVRRDTAANWTSTNPTLAAGEQGWETDTKRMKVGDGTTAWTSLGYFAPTAKLVQESNTTTTVSNTTNETNLFSFSQAAAANNSAYRIIATGTVTNSSGSGINYTWKFKIGSTTVLDTGLQSVGSSGAGAREFRLEIDVLMAGARNSQVTSALMLVGQSSSRNWDAAPLLTMTGYSASTEDLSTAKTWALTLTMATANANTSQTLNAYSVMEVTD